jgi:hypothetical protein
MIKLIFSLLLLITMISAPAWAEEKAGSEVWTNKHTVGRHRATAKFSDFELGAMTWQEDIQAHRSIFNTPITMQFVGLKGDYSYNHFFTPTWRYHHTVEFAFGNVKGQGTIPQIGDVLRDQAWLMAGVSPGLMWRTSPRSELGFGLPLLYRYIYWHIQKDSGFAIDRGSSVSVGVSAMYVVRFTTRHSLHIEVAQQHMWNAVIWSGGVDWVF